MNQCKTVKVSIIGIFFMTAFSAVGAETIEIDRVFSFSSHTSVNEVGEGGEDANRFRKLKAGGAIIVEVPHAEDFLIQSVDIPEFRAFTFWSEHLVLHTRASLEAVMAAAGFRDVRVLPHQRYGFTNHLHWFLERKPGGHEAFARFENSELEAAYRKAREADLTCDTLIGVGRK